MFSDSLVFSAVAQLVARNSARIVLASAALALALGCRGTLPPVPSAYPSDPAQAHMNSLRRSLGEIISAPGNLGRLSALRKRAAELRLESRMEWIDWFSLQRNVVIEVPGRTDRIVYLIAHYDKTDINPLKFVSLLLNGVLDEPISLSFFSEGAIDNATGVAVLLELAAAQQRRQPGYTTRVLLTGSEESGLRGSRAHVARLSHDEQARISLAINVDTVGVAGSRNCATQGVSSPDFMALTHASADEVGFDLGEEPLPGAASSDFAPFAANSFWHDFGRGLLFNLVGGLLPQRSWFTTSSSFPVLNFSACDLIGWSDWVAGTILLPIGRLHGPRDRAHQIDLALLYEQYAILEQLLRNLDDPQSWPTSGSE